MNYKRRLISLFLIGLMLAGLLPLNLVAQDADTAYDIVIRNGRVLDGAGNPWILADVAIKTAVSLRSVRLTEKASGRSTPAENTFRPDGSICRTSRAACFKGMASRKASCFRG